MASTVLVVDRDAGNRARVREFLTSNGLAIREAHSLATMRRALEQPSSTDVVIADPSVTGENHASLLAAIRGADERASIVLVVRTATLDQATAAVRQGADHLLTKPLDLAALLIVVQRLVESQQERRSPAGTTKERSAPDPFVGKSRTIRQLAEQAQRIVYSSAPILLQGETGTGKGVLANWLHQFGPRTGESFVDINCAGLSSELMESELFGHERGAFTGAAGPKLGLLEVAHRGTVFLDEIGEIDLQLQPRLLKVLEEKRFRRIGDVRDRAVDIRLIAATNRDLAARSKEGTFRADLYYRINTITLTVPPLRARREDIPLLARRVLDTLGKHDVDLAPDAVQHLVAYDWPGNIRELRNVLDRALVISNRASRLTRKHLYLEERPQAVTLDEAFQPLTLDQATQLHIERTLLYVGGSVDRAAVLLGLSRSALYKRIHRFRSPE